MTTTSCLEMVPTGIDAPSKHYTVVACRRAGRRRLNQRLFATFERIVAVSVLLLLFGDDVGGGALMVVVVVVARGGCDRADAPHMVRRMVLLLLVDEVLRKLMPRWPMVVRLDHGHFGLGVLGRVTAELVVMVAHDAVLASAVLLLLLEVVVVLGLRRRRVLPAAFSRCRRFDNLSLSGMVVAVAGRLVLLAVISVTTAAEDVLGFAFEVEIVVLDHCLIVLLQVYDGCTG